MIVIVLMVGSSCGGDNTGNAVIGGSISLGGGDGDVGEW